MRNPARLLMVLAGLLLLPAFWLPLWSIGLRAPQYSDGLGMYIGIRDIWGHEPHDIQNINILNHYIGMKSIDPAAVDVLSIMPIALGFLIAAALVVAVVARPWPIVAWLAVFAALSAAGLYEFWSWNYDYGHNLSPDAPIKVPGMSYQPPIFGRTQLLNITATSYPSWGTLFIGLAFAAGIAAAVLAFRGRGRSPGRRPAPARATTTGTAAALLVVLAGSASLSGCTPRGADAETLPGAETLAPGLPCDYCDGVVPEARFGAELVIVDGARYRFMSTECLAAFILDRGIQPNEIRSARVVDYNHGRRLIDARAAYYVRSPHLPSPNGLGLLAVETEKIARNLHFFFHGERLNWEGVLRTVRAEWQL